MSRTSVKSRRVSTFPTRTSHLGQAVALGARDLAGHVGQHEARVLAGADLVEGAHPERRQAVGGAVLGGARSAAAFDAP